MARWSEKVSEAAYRRYILDCYELLQEHPLGFMTHDPARLRGWKSSAGKVWIYRVRAGLGLELPQVDGVFRWTDKDKRRIRDLVQAVERADKEESDVVS